MKKFVLLIVLFLTGISRASPTFVPFGDSVMMKAQFYDSVTACSVFVLPFSSKTGTAYACTLLSGPYRSNQNWVWGVSVKKDTTVFQRGKQYTIQFRGYSSPDTFIGGEEIYIDTFMYRLKQGWDSSATVPELFAFKPPNLIFNSEFELDPALTDSTPTYWSTTYGTHRGTRTTAKITGTYGLYLACHTSSDTTAVQSNSFYLPPNTYLYYGAWATNPVAGTKSYIKVKNSNAVTQDSISLTGTPIRPVAARFYNQTTGDYFYLEISAKPPTSPFTADTTWVDNVMAMISTGLDSGIVARAPWNDQLILQANRTVAPVIVGTNQDKSGYSLAPGQFTKIGDTSAVKVWIYTGIKAVDSAYYVKDIRNGDTVVCPTCAAGTSDTSAIKTMMLNTGFARIYTKNGGSDTVYIKNGGTATVEGLGDTIRAAFAGNGLYTVTILTLDSANSQVIPALVQIKYNGTDVWAAGHQTATNGQFKFKLDTATYKVAAYALGYTFSSINTGTDTIKIAGNRTDTIYFTAYDPGSPTLSGLQTRVYACVYLQGLPVQNAVLKAELLNKNDYITVYNDTTDTTSVNVILSRVTVSARANQDGQVYLDLYRPRVMFPDRDYKYRFTIEDAEHQVIYRADILLPNQVQYRLK